VSVLEVGSGSKDSTEGESGLAGGWLVSVGDGGVVTEVLDMQ
jgi:hypothetical protein